MTMACGLFMLLHLIIFRVEDVVAKRLCRKFMEKQMDIILKKS